MKNKKRVIAIVIMASMIIGLGGIVTSIINTSFAAPVVSGTAKVGNGNYTIISKYDLFVRYDGPVKKKATSVTIPDTIKTGGKTYKVVSIGQGAFASSCNTLKKVSIGKNVVGIADYAFRYCSKLKTITIKTTHLTKENVKAGAFYKINSKAVITVPKQKLTEYKKILTAKNVGVTGKNQKIKGKVMSTSDGFTNTVYDPNAKVSDPEVAMGINTAFELRLMQTKESKEYSVGESIPIAMKVKMDQKLFGYWDLYMMDKGGTFIECCLCDRIFEPYDKSNEYKDFYLHSNVLINDKCNCVVSNNIFGPNKEALVAWKKIYDNTPCSATFKINLPDGLDYKEGSMKVYRTFTVPMDGFYGELSPRIKDSLYDVKVSGNEITVTIDNIKTFIPDANYHIYIDFETTMNDEAVDANVVDASLTYNYKDGDKTINFNNVTVLNQ